MKITLIILEVVLILAMLIILFLSSKERKRLRDLSLNLSGNKDNIEELLDEADQMLSELNKFSDYIITQIDLKNLELWNSIKKYDDKVIEIKEKIGIEIASLEDSLRTYKSETAKNQKVIKIVNSNMGPMNEKSKETVLANYLARESGHSNKKYKEVIKLANSGYSNTEIARKLNIGKGEIQLVLDINNLSKISADLN